MRMVTKNAFVLGLMLLLGSAAAFGLNVAPTHAGHGWMIAQQNQQQQQGQQQEQQRQQKQLQSADMQQHLLASDLIGLDVYNDRNENLGKINDIVFDRQHQRISHVLLASGGFIGIGEDYYPIPWQEVTPQFNRNRVMVPIEKSVLENTEPLDEPAREMRRMTELTGLKVQFAGGMDTQRRQRQERDEGLSERIGWNGDQQAAGELDDILLSNDGQPVFALIHPNTEMLRQIGEQEIVAVPWTQVEVNPEAERIMAQISPSDAERLTVSQYELARLDQRNFSQQLYSAVGAQMPQMDQPGQRRQPMQSDEMRKWSDFSQQCLGQNMNRANQTVEGTVENVGTLYTSPQAEAPDGLRFIVTTNQNERITVYAGPRGEVSQQLNLYRGDQVTIRGTRCQIENEQVFVASSIQANGDQFELTQKNGAPQWESKKQQQQKQQQQKQQQGGNR